MNFPSSSGFWFEPCDNSCHLSLLLSLDRSPDWYRGSESVWDANAKPITSLQSPPLNRRSDANDLSPIEKPILNSGKQGLSTDVENRALRSYSLQYQNWYALI